MTVEPGQEGRDISSSNSKIARSYLGFADGNATLAAALLSQQSLLQTLAEAFSCK